MDNWSVIILWIIDITMFIMSGVLLSGHGSNLIAGFNTSTAEAKAKYNEKKLCRTMGGGLIIISVVFAISLSFQFEFPYIFMEYLIIGILITAVGSMLVLGNTICRK